MDIVERLGKKGFVFMKKQSKKLEQRLRGAVPDTPPPALKDRILACAANTPQEEKTSRARRRRAVYWKLAASFAVLALVLSVSVSRLSGPLAPENRADAAFPGTMAAATRADDYWFGGVEEVGRPGDMISGDIYGYVSKDAADVDAIMRVDGLLPAATGVPGIDGPIISAPELPVLPDPAAGLLTAGEWCDNSDFAFFKRVLNRNDWFDYQALYQLTLVRRIAVSVRDDRGLPVRNASVALTGANDSVLFRAVTDYGGKAYLFALSEQAAQSASAVTVSQNGLTEQAPVSADTDEIAIQRTIAITLGGGTVRSPETLDLMFVIDTTGSMMDELNYLQVELDDVIRQVAEAHPNTQIRLSVNFYRDDGDDYVVLPFGFTDDISAGLKSLAAQFADGGGDYPEALDLALENALHEHDWSDNAVKLCYLVLDAPAHSDQSAVVNRLNTLLPEFAAEGVRIIPVASSGVDTETEFFLRNAATLTGGTYTFLTDDSGIGGGHLEPTIGDYEVRPLNELLVEITNRYLG